MKHSHAPHGATTDGAAGRHQRKLRAPTLGALVLTLVSLYLAVRLMPRRSGAGTQTATAAAPFWHIGGRGGGVAAALPKALAGALGTARQRYDTVRRMRTWEHGLGSLRPLPAAHIAQAATAMLVGGRRLQSGPGLSVGRPALGLTSHYAPWILADLAQWADTGITKELVDAASEKRRSFCHGSALRLLVVNGSLWVEHLTPRPDPGWYPATLGEGWQSGKGRVPYVILALMDVMREYGAEVPDVDIVMGCGDGPCAPLPKEPPPVAAPAPAASSGRRLAAAAAAQPQEQGHGASASGACGSAAGGSISSSSGSGSLTDSIGSSSSGNSDDGGSSGGSTGGNDGSSGSGASGEDGSAAVDDHSDPSFRRRLAAGPEFEDPGLPLPMFSYDTDEKHSDIPFPDFSYWGHEMDRLWAGRGQYVLGWDAQRPLLAALSAERPWGRRRGQVAWRGRQSPTGRDKLRHDYILCRERLFNDSRPGDAQLFNFFWPDVALPQLSLYRYNIYIESGAWATNFKHKLASGSPVFAIDPRAPEFFSRALQPWVHYLPLTRHDGKCNQTVAQIRAMDAAHGASHEPIFFDPLSVFEGFNGTANRTAVSGRGTRRLLAGAAGGGAAQQQGGEARADPAQAAGVAPAGRRLREQPAGGSGPQPLEVVKATEAFLDQHLCMEDVRRYLLDTLRLYASLQTFQPEPPQAAVCYDGPALLEQFATPFASDAANVSAKYPWLLDFGAGRCKGAKTLLERLG